MAPNITNNLQHKITIKKQKNGNTKQTNKKSKLLINN